MSVRLSDNLLNHAQIMYGIGPPAPRAEQHRARFSRQPDAQLAQAVAACGLRGADEAAAMVPRLLVLASDDPSLEGLRRALTEPRAAASDGTVALHCGRTWLRLSLQHLNLTWRVCDHAHADHYCSHWASRKPALDQAAEEADQVLRAADIPHKLADLTTREPPHANLEVYLLDSEALISYAGRGDRMCMTTAALSRLERFIYLFAHQCARIYLANPPWWEVEPCASACAGLPQECLEALEACAVQYLAATIALHYGADPGFWMVHPQVEESVARHWPAFVAAPEKGIDILLEQVLEDLRRTPLRPAASVHPRRLALTYDDTGMPLRCSVSDRRF